MSGPCELCGLVTMIDKASPIKVPSPQKTLSFFPSIPPCPPLLRSPLTAHPLISYKPLLTLEMTENARNQNTGKFYLHILSVLNQLMHRSDPDSITPYINAARWFPLTINPFADLRSVLFDGIEAEFAVKAREAEGEDES